jgi:hypothetical protein
VIRCLDINAPGCREFRIKQPSIPPAGWPAKGCA